MDIGATIEIGEFGEIYTGTWRQIVEWLNDRGADPTPEEYMKSFAYRYKIMYGVKIPSHKGCRQFVKALHKHGAYLKITHMLLFKD